MASVQSFFVALLGRPADPVGLSYVSGATKDGQDWSGASALIKQSEVEARFSGLSAKATVSLLYQTIFNRSPENTGLTYWISGLTSGKYDRATLAEAMVDAAQGVDAVVAGSKISAADLFTSHLDRPLELQTYMGNAASQIGRTFLSSVTPATPANEVTVDSIIQRFSQAGGQKPADGEKEPLTFTSPDYLKLTGEPAAGLTIFKATTINNIEFNTWKITGQDAAAFTIDRDSGSVSLKQDGYLREKEVATFIITATDAAGNTASQTMTIALSTHVAQSQLDPVTDNDGIDLAGIGLGHENAPVNITGASHAFTFDLAV